MHVYVRKLTRTTFPARSSARSAGELIQSVARLKERNLLSFAISSGPLRGLTAASAIRPSAVSAVRRPIAAVFRKVRRPPGSAFDGGAVPFIESVLVNGHALLPG